MLCYLLILMSCGSTVLNDNTLPEEPMSSEPTEPVESTIPKELERVYFPDKENPGDPLCLFLSPADKNALEQIKTVYPDEDADIIKCFDGDICELNRQYPIDITRLDNEEYRVVFRTETKYIVKYYDLNGEYSSGYDFYISPPKESFSHLHTGSHLSEVMITDPKGCYLFLRTSGITIETPWSEHYTDDGYWIVFFYDYTVGGSYLVKEAFINFI